MPSKPAPARSRAAPPVPSRPRMPPLPVLEQRHLDLLGLAVIAAAVLLAFVIYLGWDGGQLGDAAVEGLRRLVGAVHYAVPVAGLAAGALLVLRPVLPGVRPLRAGVVCLLAATVLGLAAGTAGLGPGGVRPGLWDVDWAATRGGLAGEGLYWLTSTLLGRIGAHVVTVALFLAAGLLLTGATVAQLVSATGASVTRTGRAVREGTVELRGAVATRRRETGEGKEPPPPKAPRQAASAGPSRSAATTEAIEATEATKATEAIEATEAIAVPAEEAPAEASPAPKTAGARRAAFWAGDERYPDLYGLERPEEAPEAAAAPGAVRLDPDDVAPEAPDAPDPDPVADKPPGLAEDPETDEPGVARTRAPAAPEHLTPQGRYRAEVTDSPDFDWRVPSPGFLKRSTGESAKPDTAGQEKVAAQLIEALGHFGVQARIVGMVAGPHITRYELRLAPGIKVGKVAQLKDDLAYALAAADIRILAPIPGKQAVGVEVPNARRRIVHLGDVLQPAPEGWSPLTVWLGKDVAGRAIGADLAKMPHLLVAGTTGAGKSGAINAMLGSVLLRATPHEVRMVLVDPKQVELNHYESIPHLLTPVITSPRKAATALQNLVREMEQRYTYMSVARTRSLPEMNKVRERRGEATLPYILCVIDELADLMMVAPADVEDSIIRLAQKARAVGIHLVLATQSPRVDVITGMIKANVPSRIAFAVSSQTDSRVILDQNGAETLLGQGDMLFSPVGTNKLQRIQGAFVDEDQIAQLTESWRRQGEPEFAEELLEPVESKEAVGEDEEEGFDPDEDALLEEAIRLVAEMGTASTSMLQRRLRLGYTRAGRLIDMLERRGVISGYEGSKPRQVLVSQADVPRVLAALGERGGDLGHGAGGEPGEGAVTADPVAVADGEPSG